MSTRSRSREREQLDLFRASPGELALSRCARYRDREDCAVAAATRKRLATERATVDAPVPRSPDPCIHSELPSDQTDQLARIEIAAFQRGAKVADMLHELPARIFLNNGDAA